MPSSFTLNFKKTKIYYFHGSFTEKNNDKYLKNAIIVDPAGSAFENANSQYNQAGLASGAIYKYIGLTGSHSLGKIESGKAKYNNQLDSIQKEKVAHLIHAVGPNNGDSKMTHEDYKTKLRETIDNIFTVIKEESNIDEKSKLWIAFYFISGGLFKGNSIELFKENGEDYYFYYLFEKFNQLAMDNKLPKFPIIFQVFSPDEQGKFANFIKKNLVTSNL